MDEDEIIYAEYPVEELEDEEELPSRTYCLDFESNHIAGMVDELEAVVQAVRKAIMTPRFKCLLYSDQYGSEIAEAVIAEDATPEYIRAAVKGFVTDALLPDTRILDVSNFKIDLKDDTAVIRFVIDTIFGETEIEEVI